MSNERKYKDEWVNVPDERMEALVNERLEKRRRKRRIMLAFYVAFCSSVIVIIAVAVAVGLDLFSSGEANAKPQVTITEDSETDSVDDSYVPETYVYIPKPEWEEQLLTPNENSRPQTQIEKVTGIVIHYVGNPNTTAKQNRDYFEDLAITKETSASSHYVVGLEGEIIQCIPLNEVAYATRHRNIDTISIEVCHPTEDGKFNEESYEAVIELVSWLVVEYDLSVEDVIRHYDVTGKECPKYFVDHESAWDDFKMDIQSFIDRNSEIRTK